MIKFEESYVMVAVIQHRIHLRFKENQVDYSFADGKISVSGEPAEISHQNANSLAEIIEGLAGQVLKESFQSQRKTVVASGIYSISSYLMSL